MLYGIRLEKATYHNDQSMHIGVFMGGPTSLTLAPTGAEDSDPQFFSKSAEKLYTGICWGVESEKKTQIFLSESLLGRAAN